MNAQPEISMPNGKAVTLSNLRMPADKVENLPAVNVGFTNLQGFELAQRGAKLLASSDLVPQQYKGNIANCVVALNMAARVGADPLMVMQNLDVVRGRPAWRAKFLISTVNTCGRFTALRYEWFGERGKDDWGCRAWAIEKSTGEKLIGPDISIALAKEEGWYGKKDSKWQTIPQKMLMYRAGAWWSDLYAPELAMGLQTREEVYDTIDAEKMDDGSFGVNLDSLRSDNNTEEKLHPTIETLQDNTTIAVQNAEAAKSTPPEEKPAVELTLIGWQKEIRNAATQAEAMVMRDKAFTQFTGDEVAQNAINATYEKKVAELKKTAV